MAALNIGATMLVESGAYPEEAVKDFPAQALTLSTLKPKPEKNMHSTLHHSPTAQAGRKQCAVPVAVPATRPLAVADLAGAKGRRLPKIPRP